MGYEIWDMRYWKSVNMFINYHLILIISKDT